jgi:ribosomal-protein-alanine N-acetyltransferase
MSKSGACEKPSAAPSTLPRPSARLSRVEADEELGQILAFRRLSPLLASAGQPEPSGIAAIGRAGFKHLINVALSTSPGALADEAALAERAGLRYLHLPIDFDAPEPEQAQRLFAELGQLRSEPVFVHCAKNMRVSALLSAYRMVLGGVSCQAARADLHAIWEPNPTWRRYVSNAAIRALPRPVWLETERLVLRDAQLGDADAMIRYTTDPEVCRYMIWGPNTPEQTRDHLERRVAALQAETERRAFELLIVEKSTGEVIGGAGLRVTDTGDLDGSLGYVLARASWGRGIMPEACAKLLEVAFGWFGLHRVWASTDAENLASQRVLEKLGMRREAHFVQDQLIKGRYRDTRVYALTESEYWASVTP